jgi:hypothetical protein
MIEILNIPIVLVFIHPIPPSDPSSGMSTLLNVRLIIDTTFTPLPAAQKKRKYYHLKTHSKATVKFELACDLRHRIVNVSEAVEDFVHDMNLIQWSSILQQMKDTMRAIGDRVYIGQLDIITSARRKNNVTREVAMLENESMRGHELASERAAMENINSRVKQWDVVRHVWEDDYDDFTFLDKVVCVVCALVNLTLDTHPIRVGRPPVASR